MNRNIGDQTLKYLHDLKGLQGVDLTKTKVTAGGVQALHKALPQCKIVSHHGTLGPNSP
jgi:hypothetical protein